MSDRLLFYDRLNKKTAFTSPLLITCTFPRTDCAFLLICPGVALITKGKFSFSLDTPQ